MTAPQPGDVKVLFLAGKGRSGGTLLAALLGQLPGFFNIGELNRLWDWGLVSESQRFGAAASDYRCGCGEPLQACPTWHAILERADQLVPELAPLAEARIDGDQAAVVRWSQTRRLFRARPGGNSGWKALDRYTAASSAVYRAITEVTGARVVVDSSRLPIEPVGLGLVPGVDVFVTQLVRDPRAVVYSWKRVKRTSDYSDDEYMPRFSASYTTTSWLARNLVTEAVGRRLPVEVVQYDDLARDPAAVVRRLAEFVGEPAGDLEFLTSETATIAPSHTVGGNPMRMTSVAIRIAPDYEWRVSIAPRDRFIATAIALPLLHRYHLPVRRGAPAGSPAPDARRANLHTLPTLTTNAWLRFDAIKHGLRTARPATVLEIGAGEGGLGSWLAARFDYTGVELDEQSRAAAAARIAADGRGEVYPSLDAVDHDDFDIACAFEVLEHIADDELALKQWHDHIRPDGWLLLSVPAHADHFGAADELVGHYRRYERDALRRQLDDAGFEVVRFSSYGAGLGHVLQRVRNTLAQRRLAQQRQEGDTPEERSSGSGRLFQPKRVAAAVACATVAAPARLVQAPFAGTDVGTGYVVLARRAG